MHCVLLSPSQIAELMRIAISNHLCKTKDYFCSNQAIFSTFALQKVGCRILKVFSNQCPQSSDRVVQCIGKADQCLDSVREILGLIKEVPIKGPVQNYDPINFDEIYADKYGE